MTRYYLKESVSNPILDRQGRNIQWEVIGGNYGVLILDTENPAHKELIEVLDNYRAQRVGGVVLSNEEEVAQKKTLPQYETFDSRSQKLEAIPDRSAGRPKVADAAAEAEPAVQAEPPKPPVEPPKEVLPQNFRPRTGRIAKAKTPDLPVVNEPTE